MQPFRFEFVHLKGETNKVADALSRTPEFECSALEILSSQSLYQDEIVAAARKDSGYVRPPPLGDRVWEKRGELWTVGTGDQVCIWVPNDQGLRAKIISEHHETLMAGHFGIRKTLARVQERFRWVGMKKEVEEFVKTCDVC